MSTRRWRPLAELVPLLLVVLTAVSTFGWADAKQDGDEAEWIGTSRFFLTLFVRHDLSAEAWPDSYWTRTQPMLARYVIGSWLWARGYDPETLDPRYDHFRKWYTNVREGRAPDNQMLEAARQPMRLLAVASAVLVFGMARLAAGPAAGPAAGLLFSLSPYLALHLVRAKGDATLLAFFLAAQLAGLLAIRRGGAHGPCLAWGVLAGVLLGLALGAKLTAILGVLAVALWGAWALLGPVVATCLARLARLPPDGPAGGGHETPLAGPARPRMTRRACSLWALGVVLLAPVPFVASNPFLHRDPLGHTWLLFQNRREEMARQAAVDPARAVTSATDRIARVWRHSLVADTWGSARLRWPVEAALAVVGAALLAARAARPRPGVEAWLLLWAACVFGGVIWGLGYQLDHYFGPTAATGTLLAGLAVGWGADALRPMLTEAVVRWRRHPAVGPGESMRA